MNIIINEIKTLQKELTIDWMMLRNASQGDGRQSSINNVS